jgi:ammonium transporter, Amt family
MRPHKQRLFKNKINKPSKQWQFFFLSAVTVILLLVWSDRATAQDIAKRGFSDVGTIWLVVSAALVFFMNAGFAMLETGFCRTSNAINVLAKNLIVFCIATLAFWLFGFKLMFGDNMSDIFGQTGLFLDLPFPSANDLNPFPTGFEKLRAAWSGRPFAAVFFFQLVFAGTTATIVSGAVAERIKFWAFILFSFAIVGFIYPFTGHWIWGGGWLFSDPIRFRDFAGSTAVHSVGGMAALVGAWLLNPRKGRFGYDPQEHDFSMEEDPDDFKPYDLGLATLGCFILWLGWFGFNGGSTTRLEYVPHIVATTLFAAAIGGIAAVLLSPALTAQKVSLSSIINGILGGLVGITASSAYVDMVNAGIIGAVSGVLVLLGERLLKFLRIDDPVGAVPVHLFCGGWGTLAVGFFASTNSEEYKLEAYDRLTQIFYQFLGWSSVVGFVGICSLLAWLSIGIFLYCLERRSDASDSEEMLEIDDHFDKEYGPLGWIANLFQMGRQGLRVSVAREAEGSDETIIA